MASGGTIVGTRDDGAVTLDGGRSILTGIPDGGSLDVANGGAAIGTLVGSGRGLFIPGTGSISATVIEGGGYVTMGNEIGGTGTGSGMVIDDGTENLYAYSSETNDLIENGGVQNLEQDLVVARNVTIDRGGEQISPGQTYGVVVNDGGEQLMGFRRQISPFGDR